MLHITGCREWILIYERYEYRILNIKPMSRNLSRYRSVLQIIENLTSKNSIQDSALKYGKILFVMSAGVSANKQVACIYYVQEKLSRTRYLHI